MWFHLEKIAGDFVSVSFAEGINFFLFFVNSRMFMWPWMLTTNTLLLLKSHCGPLFIYTWGWINSIEENKVTVMATISVCACVHCRCVLRDPLVSFLPYEFLWKKRFFLVFPWTLTNSHEEWYRVRGQYLTRKLVAIFPENYMLSNQLRFLLSKIPVKFSLFSG